MNIRKFPWKKNVFRRLMESILRLQQRLNAIRNSSTYIIDVYVYIQSVQKKISAFDRVLL
ncbi:hypothetical protein NST99_24520 [Paenibacillus sp. FSL L8-0470]|uniref:hypothetical protein n=1 Tax=Paenibacillus sp. FSL L8-0470 TaxID=2954688 RepID=UPI0030F70AD3